MVSRAKDWLELHELLRGAVGEPTAGALMDFLPPVGWADVATKDDLRALEASLRGEMAELRGELRGEMAELRGEITGHLGEFKADMLRWMATTLVAGMAMSAGIAAAVSTAMGA